MSYNIYANIILSIIKKVPYEVRIEVPVDRPYAVRFFESNLLF